MSSKRWIAALTLVLALPFCGGASWAQEAAESAEAAAEGSPEALARELLELTGAAGLGQQVMTQMVESFRGMDPSVPAEFWDQFLASVDPQELVEQVVPIYVEHLTEEEMRAAIEFFSSPAGRSLVSKQPQIAAESMAAGQAWGQELAREVVERLELYKSEQPES